MCVVFITWHTDLSNLGPLLGHLRGDRFPSGWHILHNHPVHSLFETSGLHPKGVLLLGQRLDKCKKLSRFCKTEASSSAKPTTRVPGAEWWRRRGVSSILIDIQMITHNGYLICNYARIIKLFFNGQLWMDPFLKLDASIQNYTKFPETHHPTCLCDMRTQVFSQSLDV